MVTVRPRRWLMLSMVVVVCVLAGVTVRQQFATAGPPDLEQEHEALVHIGSATCGVERWHVKTGIDRDARKVDQSHVVATSIFHLRSLPAPSFLPSYTRIKPTELTVFRITGYLLRFKEEADSDYHLVIADSGGRSMIAEIPAPDCVGTGSPFLQRIRAVRSAFDRRYRVTDFWRRLRVAVTITGVGFFDFLHGQSGVAPNAIELHPVLSISYGKSTSAPPPVRPTPQPTAPVTAGGSLPLSLEIRPSVMTHNAYPVLTARTAPGAICSASVVYSTGASPLHLDTSERRVPSNGTLTWTWHEETSGSGGTATVVCRLGGRTATRRVGFTVRR